MVTVEENTLNGGFGSEVSKLLQESNLCDIQMKNIGIPDEFVEQGTQAILRARYNLDAEGIVKQVLTLFPDHDSGSSLNTKGKVMTTQS